MVTGYQQGLDSASKMNRASAKQKHTKKDLPGLLLGGGAMKIQPASHKAQKQKTDDDLADYSNLEQNHIKL